MALAWASGRLGFRLWWVHLLACNMVEVEEEEEEEVEVEEEEEDVSRGSPECQRCNLL